MAKKKDAAASQENAAPLPLFYNSVTAISKEKHADLRIKTSTDASFAKTANAIMITAVEFGDAALHYPIVFGTADLDGMPFVVTSKEQGSNIYVEDDGQWREKAYIPAYVRRFPFILIENDGSDQLVLGVDESSGFLSKTEGVALFENGEGSEAANNIMTLCLSFQREYTKTKLLAKQIQDTGLLVEKFAELKGENGGARLTGFRIIDEKAFNALDDKTVLELRKTGALAMIYAHLISMKSWKFLAV